MTLKSFEKKHVFITTLLTFSFLFYSSYIHTNTSAPTQTSVLSTTTYQVIKVVDGDTISVQIGSSTEKVRLLGINTPETVDPRKPVQCFGKEASNKTKSLLTDQRVILESDITQGDTDKYGRLLRYVFLPNGTNINLLLIQQGYAYEYTYNKPYKYQTEFKEAQKEAEVSKSGLWGDGMCTK